MTQQYPQPRGTVASGGYLPVATNTEGNNYIRNNIIDSEACKTLLQLDSCAKCGTVQEQSHKSPSDQQQKS